MKYTVSQLQEANEAGPLISFSLLFRVSLRHIGYLAPEGGVANNELGVFRVDFFFRGRAGRLGLLLIKGGPGGHKKMGCFSCRMGYRLKVTLFWSKGGCLFFGIKALDKQTDADEGVRVLCASRGRIS